MHPEEIGPAKPHGRGHAGGGPAEPGEHAGGKAGFRCAFGRRQSCGRRALPFRRRREPLAAPGGEGPGGKPGYPNHGRIGRRQRTGLQVTGPVAEITAVGKNRADARPLPPGVGGHEGEKLGICHRARVEPERDHGYAFRLVFAAQERRITAGRDRHHASRNLRRAPRRHRDEQH